MDEPPETIAVELPFDLINRLIGLQAITGKEPQVVVEAVVRRYIAGQDIAIHRYIPNFLQKPESAPES
jgi:hypothetical protein